MKNHNKSSIPVPQVNGKINGFKKKKYTTSKKKRSNKATNGTETIQENDNTTIVKCNKLNLKSQPVITKDSEHIICPCGNIVAIFRRKTGFLEKSFTQHKYDVTNIYINNKNPSQIISCSSQEFLVWDYTDMSLVKRYGIPFAALQWYVSPRCYEDVFYKRAVEGVNSDTVKMELVKWNVNATSTPVVLGSVSRDDKCVAITNNGEHVVYSYKNRLYVYPSLYDNNEPLRFDSTYIVCLVLHPTEFIICTGDKKGKIVVWYNLQDGEGKHVCMMLHWHHHSIADMAFTNDGHYLMSGGKESVLVIWQLETKKKNFVPRVGGVIQHLSQSFDDQFICVTLRNNMLKIISATTLKLRKTIKYLSQAYELPAGLAYHSPTDCLVLNGIPDGVLQFYQPREDLVKLSVDMIGENYVSDVERRYVYPTRVTLMAFSDDGKWMATIDEREDRLLPTERKLKFWKYSEETKKYLLSTLVDPPHKGEVYSLCFRPLAESHDHEYMVVTTSEDGDIKTWLIAKENDRTDSTMESWQNYFIGSYGAKSCRKACFSQNGNLLAVLFCAVTLWDPETLTLKKCLEFNAKNNQVKDVAFACNESSQFLIGYSNYFLIVWNVADSSIVWMLKVNVCLITCDRYSKYCAAFIKSKHGAQTTDLYLFEPSSPSPKCLYRNVLNDKKAVVSSALFAQKEIKSHGGKTVWAETGQLYILTETTEILTVKEVVDEDDGGEKGKKTCASEDGEKSAFEDIFGSISNGNVSDDSDDDDDNDSNRTVGAAGQLLGNPSSTFIRKLLGTPANVLPAADVLCKAYIKSMLLPKMVEADVENVSMETEIEGDIENSKKITEDSHKKSIEDAHKESILNGDANDIDVYGPPKGLLKKLKRLNFDFVVDPFG